MIKIVNRLENGLSTIFLERMVEWVRKQVKLPKHYTKEVKFKHLPKKSRTQYSGFSFNSEKRIIVSISRDLDFPLFDPGHRGRFGQEYCDIYELIVAITTHELRHQYQDHNEIRWDEELDAYKTEYKVSNIFRDQKEELLEEWSRKEQMFAIGSKAWYNQTLSEIMDVYIFKGGDMNITVDELINYYKGLTILR